MELRNITLGFTESDVHEEGDLHTLTSWRTQIEKDISNMQHQLEMALVKYKEQAIPYEREWFVKTKSSKRMQGILLSVVNNRIKRLKNERAAANDFAYHFVIVARENLLEETFEQLKNKVNERS